MKKFFWGAAAALAIAAPAAHAAVGYVGLDYGNVSVDPGSLDDNQWALEGSAAFDAGSGIGIAVDAGVADGENSDTTSAITGHVFGRDDDNHLLGVFAGFTDTSIADTWNAGGEGQLFINNTTFGAAVTYLNADDVNVTGWGVNGAAKFFPNDNLAFGGHAGWFSLDGATAATDTDAWAIGVGGEYQLSSYPVSFTAGYDHYDANDTNVSVNVWTIGARYNFGGATLKARNHAGGDLAGLSGVSSVHF